MVLVRECAFYFNDLKEMPRISPREQSNDLEWKVKVTGETEVKEMRG